MSRNVTDTRKNLLQILVVACQCDKPYADLTVPKEVAILKSVEVRVYFERCTWNPILGNLILRKYLQENLFS